MADQIAERQQQFANVPEDQQPDFQFVLHRWHRELENRAQAREQDVGATATDLEVAPCHAAEANGVASTTPFLKPMKGSVNIETAYNI